MVDNIPPEIGIPAAIILWIMVVLMLRRERRDRER